MATGVRSPVSSIAAVSELRQLPGRCSVARLWHFPDIWAAARPELGPALPSIYNHQHSNDSNCFLPDDWYFKTLQFSCKCHQDCGDEAQEVRRSAGVQIQRVVTQQSAVTLLLDPALSLAYLLWPLTTEYHRNTGIWATWRQQSPVSPPRALSCPVVLLTAHILDMVTTWSQVLPWSLHVFTVLVTVTDAADDDMTTVAYLWAPLPTLPSLCRHQGMGACVVIIS